MPNFSTNSMLREVFQRLELREAAELLALEMLHEVKNPLEALGNLTYLALHEADSTEAVRRYLTQSQEQMGLLNQIAKQTLGFAKSSSVPQPSSLSKLADAALLVHRRTIERKQIHVVKSYQGELELQLHQGQMLQVISNLIANALDALPESGHLRISLKKRAGKAAVVIADNGHGIPKAHLNKIFEPFFTTKENEGNRLGLSLSKKIVTRHEGSIRVRSCTRPGRNGTVFAITLPA